MSQEYSDSPMEITQESQSAPHVQEEIKEEPSVEAAPTEAYQQEDAAEATPQDAGDSPVMVDGVAIPSMEELAQERAALQKEIRHHKDEQDAIVLSIENQPGAGELYRTAARVQHAEYFAHRCMEYVEESMPKEIVRAVAAEEINSEKKVAKYIKELQAQREHILKKVSEIQDRLDRRQDPNQWYFDAVKAKYECKNEQDKKTVEHALSNAELIEELEKENAQLRDDKSKISGQLIRTNRESKQRIERLNYDIQKANAANALHSRQCHDLNLSNGSKTGNLQVLLNELNTSHYGVGKAPSKKEVKQRIKELTESYRDDEGFVRPEDITEEDLKRLEEKKSKKSKKHSETL